MKKFLVLMSILAISAFYCAWAQVSRAPGDLQYDQGKRTFNANCRVCHILKSEGDQPTPYYLRFRPGDFSDQDFWKTHDDKKIENAVKNGKGAMPPQRLNPEEIKTLIQFMNVEFKKTR